MKKQVSGFSHAKIILMGEHSVVYGEPAIALPLTKIMTIATLIPTKHGQTIASRCYQGPLALAPAKLAGVIQLITELNASFKHPLTNWELIIKSDLPIERGMGSSAATAVAITRAFFKYHHIPLSPQKLFRWVTIAEKITHQNPSGLDTIAVSTDTPLWFVKPTTSEKLFTNLNANLIIADTGIKGATKEAIITVKKQLATEPLKTSAHLHQMGTLTRTARQAILQGDTVHLGQTMNAYQTELATLKVSLPELDRLISIAQTNGALGAKLTGGGKGGCMIALTTPSLSTKIAMLLKAAGAHRIWIQPLMKGTLK